MIKDTDLRALELYVHIPFCAAKCDYCDFLSAPADSRTQNNYVEQLLRQIQHVQKDYKDYQITTIFIGGGTPSLLPSGQLRRLFTQLRRCFCIRTDAEITIECNPGTVDKEKLESMREIGVNRLSFGLQSADESELRMLGRIHTFEQFLDNYVLARRLGFDNINIDLMSALPGQSLRSYEHTLESVLRLEPEHISAYSLIIEEGTPFFERYARADRLRAQGLSQRLLPDEEEERLMYERTRELLGAHGYRRYEISNYARAGRACRHNIGYWRRQDYLGLGLGAASLVDNVRFSNTRDLNTYLSLDFTEENAGCESIERLSVPEQMEEFMFLGLRVMQGVSAEEFRRQFSCSIEDIYGEVLADQIKEGLLRRTPEGYCLTDRGIDISNYVMAQYLRMS